MFSVEKLILKTTHGNVKTEKVLNSYRIEIECGYNILADYLDRSQAHLLMLYLQEHLGNHVPTIEKKMWYCSRCDKYHAVDYSCERI